MSELLNKDKKKVWKFERVEPIELIERLQLMKGFQDKSDKVSSFVTTNLATSPYSGTMVKINQTLSSEKLLMTDQFRSKHIASFHSQVLKKRMIESELEPKINEKVLKANED